MELSNLERFSGAFLSRYNNLKFRSKKLSPPPSLHSCQIRSVFARRPVLIWPLVLVLSRPGLQGHHPGPLGKVRGGRFCPHQGVFVPRVQSRRRAQLGVSGQQTHTNVCAERQRATSPVRSTSLPPFLCVNIKL